MSVSVVISTRDRPQALARCLDGLAAGTALPAEVVIVDQSRGDETETVVRTAEPFLPLVYLHHAGTGLGASQNLGIRAATQDVVAVVDDDCVPSGDWVAGVAAEFAESPDLGLVGGGVLALGPAAPGVEAVSTRTSTRPVEFRSRVEPWNIGSGNNFALRRLWFDRIGGCDERLGPGAPGRGGLDMDLFYRLARAGAPTRYQPRLVVHHERKSHAERLARRTDYGFGMGACCALWLRERDLFALRVLGLWTALRSLRLLAAATRRDWRRAREEVLVLGGTVRGLAWGANAPPRPRSG
ncbi:MAG: hypothetical protein QOI67_1732 [Gaiellaceae bacterium]|jgi:GT2 family glycosyltransferase|nr:hypothetical protein [Gaiellaceae bacterium]